MAAIICAIVTWGFVNVLDPAWGDVLDAQVISPTFKMLLNLLKALASFMIFFNVVNAICHMGDVNTLSRLGMGLVKRAEKYNFAAMVMIGIITYISVLERKKEIGILRAIGASKGNISSIFNAETFIIGLLSGIFGIGISLPFSKSTEVNILSAVPVLKIVLSFININKLNKSIKDIYESTTDKKTKKQFDVLVLLATAQEKISQRILRWYSHKFACK